MHLVAGIIIDVGLIPNRCLEGNYLFNLIKSQEDFVLNVLIGGDHIS